MKPLVEEVLIDLILEDVLNDGTLFEMNPYHDAAGKFTSKGASELYRTGALAFGRAKGMKAKVQGLGKDQIRAAIKGGIEKHLSGNGDRGAGQQRLDLVRGMAKRGTLPPAPAPKAQKAPREPRAAKDKREGGNMDTFLLLVKKQHGEAMKRADAAVTKIKNKEGDQVQARKDWNQAHADMAELRGKIETVQKKLQARNKPAHEEPKAKAPRSEPEQKANHQEMSTDALTAKMKELQSQHAALKDEHRAAQEGIRGRATHSEAGRFYKAMAHANEAMEKLTVQMAQVATELKKRGKA